MDTVSFLVVVLLIMGIITCGVAVYALVEAVQALRSTRRLAEGLNEQLIPLVQKADVTIDAVNAELLRIDGIVTRFEDMSDRASTTASAVQDAVNAPIEAVNAMGSRLRQVWKTARQRRSE